ncbi:L,D-transpeptidase family protein [Psychromarinibacter halotolerans]|uniref:Murein L,D-transpeptidase family protein n=1 Tax=Psychromarinibacter halotolerans TaxID=1775175 RepID=A0ABV7GNS2_9RHOB|nr:L,D-transpeptidase family protein [Psychromarinibacter halotolerans]MDF0595893.1 L,D-transpeptidase family protein [Psychromarinibacter halotolerans]
MRNTRVVLALCILLALGACSKFRTYNGPEVTRIVVYKGERKMYLLHHDSVLATHDIDLGFAPAGHKQFEGDGKTPEGRYYIDRRNPNSKFHLSLGISYPNPDDIAFAAKNGRSPGGDIFIHGEVNRDQRKNLDWTAGCIAVKKREMEKIYAMVGDGTVIDIYP